MQARGFWAHKGFNNRGRGKMKYEVAKGDSRRPYKYWGKKGRGGGG